MKKKIVPFVAIYMAASMQASSVFSQPPPPPRPPAIEDRIKHVSEKIDKEISLTSQQKEKINMAYKDFFIAADKMREKQKEAGTPPPQPPPPPPGKKEEMDKLGKVRDEKIRLVLDAAQYKKYQTIEKTMRPAPPPRQ